MTEKKRRLHLNVKRITCTGITVYTFKLTVFTSSQNIIRSLRFLENLINRRLQCFFQKDSGNPFLYPELALAPDNTPLNRFLNNYQLNLEEYTVLLLALVPHLQPNFIDTIVQAYLPNGGDFAEIGGTKGNNHRSMLPTGETALFLLAGNDLEQRIRISGYFSSEHFFAKGGILTLEPVKEGEPKLSGRLILQQEYVELFTVGKSTPPSFGPDFPAQRITTKLDWQNLVLNQKTAQQIHDIKTWLLHNDTLLKEWGMENKIKRGYRALFYGPSGTGKTFTVTLLGKQFEKDVYRIDLSQVVSKYIGETEKNLEKIFTKAENRNWILFFDEADALFGKRSNIQSAHDKYANQEVSYLLQRVEDFPGLIVLASNFKSNLDQAFVRRFNAVVHFPLPNPQERYEIWKGYLPEKALLAADIDLWTIAGRYELSGSAIVNVIHYVSLQAIGRGSTVLSKEDILEGIKREYEKEDKVYNG